MDSVNWRLMCQSGFLKPNWTTQSGLQENLVYDPLIGVPWPNRNTSVSFFILAVTSRNVHMSHWRSH